MIDNIARDIIDNAICDYERGVGNYRRLADCIITYLRRNGYVIKRAMPPCVAHSQEGADDAS